MLEDFLRSHADRLADKVAIACGEKTITYSALYAQVQEEARRLEAECWIDNAPAHSQPVTIRASQTIDFLVAYFAAHLAGRPFVPLENDISDESFFEIRNLLGSATLPKGVADILFTSGAAGKPKGAMISHEAIIANADNLVCSQGFSTELTFIVSGSLCHVENLSKIWASVVVGATIVLTDGMNDIEAFFNALEYPFHANAFDCPCSKIAMFLVPSSIRMLLQFAPKRLAAYADSIDFIETGAALLSLSDMERLCATLPRTRLYNTYASAETGVIATHNYNAPLGMIAGCLGLPMKHSKVVIGDDGRIMCGGKTLMMGYVGGKPLLSHDSSLLTTMDLGSIDSLGRLRLEGRVDDIIHVGGRKVSPLEVENAAMHFPSIADCICVSAKHPILGNVLKLIYVVAPSAAVAKSALVLHLRHELDAFKVPLVYEQVEQIARNANGNLDRKYYREKWSENN